jgi:ketosteroid isomerase-like protein
MSESNAELARRGYEAALRGDLELIGDLLDPDVKWHGGDPSAEGACRNRAEALEFMRGAFARGGPGELVDVVAAGDKVVVVMRRAPALTANVSTFRDGKVVEMVHHADANEALAAVGGG